MLLKDKVVIVSGIGPGLGQALATLAAQEGARLVISARTPAKLDTAEAEVAALGLDTEVLKVPCDISVAAECEALVAATIARFGRVDCLINSAYTAGKLTLMEDSDLEDWRHTLDTNLFGSLALCLAVFPAMKAQGGGAIVNVNTQVTRKPLLCQGGYGASKAALAHTTAQLALEWGQYGIRVNSTFMGWMWGSSVEAYIAGLAAEGGPSVEEQKAEVAKNVALRVIPPDRECAKGVIMLLSDYASMVTGASLDINGGEFLPI
ncbi:short-chain dehydrogenase [Sphingomonas sp. DBB INV C78]|uniref:SDR family oxidoreductase n=1 Tax=Sphingomonas sp. DBB INV C78 TaxID=3349434 RepID=UPI0036D225E2